MKNIKYLLLGLSVVFLMNSCDKELDIDPAQSISTDKAVSTPENIQNILVGSYGLLLDSYMLGGRTQIYADLLGNNVSSSNYVNWYGTYSQLRQMNGKTITSDNSYVENTWATAYKLIFQTNTIIDNLAVVTDASDKARIEGEAKFLRAFSYYELVKLYGKTYEAGKTNTQLAVPIMLSSKVDFTKDLNVARNTVEEVYSQIIKDLTEAVSKLPTSNSYYADKNAAKALLARVYLQKGDTKNARDFANDVIENGGYSLVSDYTKAFNTNENTSEDVFALHITSQSGFNDLNLFYADDIYGGRGGDIAVRSSYTALFESADVRRSFFHFNIYDDRLTSKFINQFGNIHVVRLAEMYLIRAEANLKEGTSIGATPSDDVNLVRTRSGASTLSSVTLNDILLERRRELGFEGFLVHDIKRTKGVLGTGSWTWDSDKLVFPIPLREMQVNTKLVQNPGYN
ncbi:membrane protein [Cloacibacterium rupense]|uniref:Membrane protein n=1 Tax=Cloacibacterium rupense TaxID=517423 RepID=A0ABQ2NG60_9FLAO|nr:RagB/SusD family nutrient uptake outer membrane protein [Cloacibacterium rupense]GGP02512.1 membrane protein [Cloacibacterium rupense]